MKLTEFNETDWHGFSGAESPHEGDGDAPQITYHASVDDKAYIIVVDRDGVQFIPNYDISPGIMRETYMKHIPFRYGIIMVEALIEDVSSELLIDVLGFRVIPV